MIDCNVLLRYTYVLNYRLANTDQVVLSTRFTLEVNVFGLGKHNF